jgi:hypothetical protein
MIYQWCQQHDKHSNKHQKDKSFNWSMTLVLHVFLHSLPFPFFRFWIILIITEIGQICQSLFKFHVTYVTKVAFHIIFTNEINNQQCLLIILFILDDLMWKIAVKLARTAILIWIWISDYHHHHQNYNLNHHNQLDIIPSWI